MKNDAIQKLVNDTLDGMTQHALGRLDEGLDAMKTKCFVTKAGAIVRDEPQVDQAARLRAVELWDRLRQRQLCSARDNTMPQASETHLGGSTRMWKKCWSTGNR
jgi:hypothetical protein